MRRKRGKGIRRKRGKGLKRKRGRAEADDINDV